MEQNVPTKPKQNIFQQIVGMIFLVLIIWAGCYIFVPPFREYVNDLIAPMVKDLKENQMASVKKSTSQIRDASGSDVVSIDISQFSKEWEAMTDVKRDARSKEFSGKFLELSHVVYDVSRMSQFSDGSIGKYTVSFGSANIFATAYHLSCDFLTTDADYDAKIAALNTGDLVKFRGTFDSVGYTGMKMRNCVISP